MPERLTDAELDDLEDGAGSTYTADLAIRARTELRDLRAEVERLNQENLAIRALPRAASEPSTWFGRYYPRGFHVGNWGPDEEEPSLRGKVITGVAECFTLLEPKEARGIADLFRDRASLAEGLTWEQVGAKNRAEKEEVRKLRAENEALRKALENYMSQFGQALEANGIAYGPAQQAADDDARTALATADAMHEQEPTRHTIRVSGDGNEEHVAVCEGCEFDATHSQVIGGAP